MPGTWSLKLKLMALACLALGLSAAARGDDPRPRPVIFAAASLIEALPAILGSDSATYVFGPSATLARQIEAGAPADLYISANPEWTTWLAGKGRLHDENIIVGNRLVLAVPVDDATPEYTLIDAPALLAIMGDRRLAIADPRTAPAGQYAEAFLAKLGLAETLGNRLAMGESVRATLRLVEKGGLPGLVYESDTAGNLAVRIIAPIEETKSGAIRYSGGLTSDRPGVKSLMARLTSPESAALWRRFGFVPTGDLPHNGTE